METKMSSATRTTKPPPSTEFVTHPPYHGHPLRLFTVDEYHEMIEAGVFKNGARCELIHGVILEKPVPDPPHSKSTHRLMRRLTPLFPEPDWVVGIQDSITLPDSEPEPDFYAATGPESKYDDRHPSPKDLVLVIEVSDTSLGFDRGMKLAMYAKAKVIEYWIVNIEQRQIEVYTQPKGGKNPMYKQHTNYGPDDAVPVVIGGQELGRIAVKELLP
jgi:Uma2 family endonuclease